jgi:hypothetical protein
MITCHYCGNELTLMTTGPYLQNAKCNLCNIILGPDSKFGMYSKDGERPTRMRLHLVTSETAMLPLTELLKLHTADLLIALKAAREARKTQYDLLRTFNKAIKHGSEQYIEYANLQGYEYEVWTRACWRIENILLERLGYYPDKITDSLIVKFEERCKMVNKRMKIAKKIETQ